MIARSSRSTLSPEAADTGMISAKSASLLQRSMIGSSLDFRSRSILLRIRNTGALDFLIRSIMN
jgi:hypothetical protein